MKSLAVDYRPRGWAPTILWGVLCLTLTLLAAQQLWAGWQLHQRIQSMQAEIARAAAERELAQQKVREAELARQQEQPNAREVEAALRLMRFPLDQVLRSLENTRIPGVRLVSLDIDAAEGRVQVDLEFAADDSLLQYLDVINAGEPSPRWKLVQAKWREPGGATASTATISSHWGPEQR
jgi:hypothetical protein